MSPQLHRIVYGYFPHDFFQQIREGNFRPVVFMGHGLLVSVFVATSVIAAAALWRTRDSVLRLPAAGTAAVLSGLLVLCRSLGSLVYGATAAPLARFATPRVQGLAATALAIVALIYPVRAQPTCSPLAPL